MFGRVPSGRSDSWPRPDVHVGVGVALLVVDRNRLLLVRTARAPVLRLPGGRLRDGEDAHRVLAHEASDLGVPVDESSLVRSTLAPSLTVREGDAEVETLCFETAAGAELERSTGGGRSVWVSARTPGVFTPSASEALTVLNRLGHVH